jgi:hypothetical protein
MSSAGQISPSELTIEILGSTQKSCKSVDDSVHEVISFFVSLFVYLSML